MGTPRRIFTAEEHDYIKDNYTKVTQIQMAEHLDVCVLTIRKYQKKHGFILTSTQARDLVSFGNPFISKADKHTEKLKRDRDRQQAKRDKGIKRPNKPTNAVTLTAEQQQFVKAYYETISVRHMAERLKCAEYRLAQNMVRMGLDKSDWYFFKKQRSVQTSVKRGIVKEDKPTVIKPDKEGYKYQPDYSYPVKTWKLKPPVNQAQ
jgi:hypothetical protein